MSRLDRARAALETYPDRGSLDERVTDLIADLLHLLEAEGHEVDEIEGVPAAGLLSFQEEREEDDGVVLQDDDGPIEYTVVGLVR